MNTPFQRARRRQVTERIDVYDTIAERVLGVVANLSESGMMLHSAHALPEEALLQLRLILPTPGGQPRSIDVGAQRLWSEPAQSPGQYWMGLRFIDISPDDLASLRIWIDLPGGHYV